MLLKQIYDPYLSQYAYLIGCPDTGEALIIDAQRDIDRYRKLAAANDLTITAAAETHIHADFLGGIRQLVEKDDEVRGYLSKMGGKDWQYKWALDHDRVQLLGDGDRFKIGSVSITAIHCPGHTPEHLGYLIEETGNKDTPYGFVSGDFIFVGDVGRPDLLEEAAGEAGTREDSAETLYNSVRKIDSLDDYIALLPGHGAGSSCGKSLGSIPYSTIGYEKRTNPSVRKSIAGEKEDFMADILAAQPAPALYFARMKNSNRDGVELYDELPCPKRFQPEELAKCLSEPAKDIIPLDTRSDREAFMKQHILGSIYAPFGAQFSQSAGSYIQPDQTIYLLLEELGQLEDCVRQLVRIGIDRIEGYALVEDLLGQPDYEPLFHQIKTIPVSEIDPDGDTVLDVRSADEYEEGHVPGAVNVPHTRLVADADQLPDDNQPLTIHCGSGARASLASAALARMGYKVTFADGMFKQWLKTHRNAA